MNLTFKSTEPLLQLTYEIYNEDKKISKLEFEYARRVRNRATATIDGKEFNLGGWVLGNTNIEVTDSQTQKNIGNYFSKFLSDKGTLKLGDKKYTIQQKKSKRLEYGLFSQKGEEIITYTLEGFMLNKGEIYVSPEIEKDSELKFLITIGLYVILRGGQWRMPTSKTSVIILSAVFTIFIATLIFVFYLMQRCQSC